MFCYKCGGPVDDNQAFCPTCGAPTNTAARGENVNQSVEATARANAQVQNNIDQPYSDYNQPYYGMNQPVNYGANQPNDYSNHGMILNGVNVGKKKKVWPVVLLVVLFLLIVAALSTILVIKLKENKKNKELQGYLAAAEEEYDKGNYDRAIRKYNKALDMDEKCAKAYIGIAECYQGLGDEVLEGSNIDESDFDDATDYYNEGIDSIKRGLRKVKEKDKEDLEDMEESLKDSITKADTLLEEYYAKLEPPEEPPVSVDPPTVTGSGDMTPPSTDNWTTDDKIYVYSYNEELESKLEFVLEKYPEYRDYVEYVNLNMPGMGDEYMNSIDNLLSNGIYADEYPSIICTDSYYTRRYVESDYSLNLYDIGITSNMYADAYQFTKDMGTHDGQLKAMTWASNPGCFMYRADIAEEVFGTSDPDVVQLYVKDWDTFIETAATMDSYGYDMISSLDDISNANFSQNNSPWVKDYELELDSSVDNYFEVASKLYDNGYTHETTRWSMEWDEDLNGAVFGYFGCPWFLYWCMDSTDYEWKVTQGPSAFYWGGQYVHVMKDCPNTELAAFLVYEICCDDDIMYDIAVDSKDFVNNKSVIQREIDEDLGKASCSGDQNPLEVFNEAGKQVDLSHSTVYDSKIQDIILDEVDGYVIYGNHNNSSDAIDKIKERVHEEFPEVTVN